MKLVNFLTALFLIISAPALKAEGNQPIQIQSVQGTVASSQASALAASAGVIGNTLTIAVLVNASAIIVTSAIATSEDDSGVNINTTTR
ncbi:MAG: hypothetical protein ABJN96_13580 [Marinomonas sp.]